MTALTEHSHRRQVERLCQSDPALAALVAGHGPPPFWVRPPGFATLVLFILEQQVSLASAAAAFDRLSRRTGEVTAETVIASTDEELRADGFSRQKAGYVRDLAGAVLSGGLVLDELGSMSDEEVRRCLISQRGIGAWTADVYLLSCLRRPDVWPVGDRALQVAALETLGLQAVPSAAELERVGERWRPHRSTAARLLWHGYLSRRGR